MLSTPHKKSGRPTSSYRIADGTRVEGLSRKADGRWVISATGKCFTEPVEAFAIVRFREIMGIAEPAPLPIPTASDITADDSRRLFLRSSITESPELWAWFRHQLLSRPAYVAQAVGIEQIAYLSKLAEPELSASLESLGTLYLNYKQLSRWELCHSKGIWSDFVKVAARLGVTSVDGVNHALAKAYESHIAAKKFLPATLRHYYQKIRSVLRFAIKRGVSIVDCRKGLDALAKLEVNEVIALDPKPVSPADFWAIHGEAVKSGDATFGTLLLMALNTATYSGEVAAVKFSEIDLKTCGYVGRRTKTNCTRVAVLFPSLVAALKAMQKQDEDHVFIGSNGRPFTSEQIRCKWRKYRRQAGVSSGVLFASIRDAAYGVAMHGSDFSQAEMLMGHKLPGTADNYLRRNPQLVQAACASIAKAFNVAGQ